MPTTYPTTSVPTTVPKVCEDITQLTSSVMSSLPVSPVTISPAPATKASDFEFSSPAGTSTVEYAITVQKGGVLVNLNLEGSFTSYQVFVSDEDGTKEGPVESTSGEDTYEPGQVAEFNKNITDNHSVTVIITGPSTGFVVNVTEFALCLPEFKYCQLTQEEVLSKLKYLPLNGVLGLSKDDGEEVNYGLDMAEGDVLEEGTIVKGHCYECECVGFELQCRPVENCQCPNYTARCEGSCDDPVLVVEFDVEGVDPACKPNDTCVPEECTTPHECPSTWTEWSECDNCMRTRTRKCHESCGTLCDQITTTESDICGDCTTTQEICDGDNEEYKCYNHYIQCNESCRMLHNEPACEALMKIDEDMPCNYTCACVDGYKRNSAGHCVKAEECECYNGTIPLPVNYRENVSECKYCECKMEEGYVCHEREDCCEIGEWEEWSECSVTCGTGKRTRTRTVKSGDCKNETLVEDYDCMPAECPCIIDGKVWGPNDVVDDECRYCKCVEGELSCTPKNNTQPWTPDCDHTCYCAYETGEKICVNTTRECDVDPTQCNNDTHYTEEDPNDPCCMVCKPRMKPCEKQVVETRTLNFTDPNHGLCVSDPLEVSNCVGSCGFSESGGNHYEYRRENSDLPVFDLDYYSNCECCQAELAANQVQFRCDATEEYITISVTQISGCKCMQCT